MNSRKTTFQSGDPVVLMGGGHAHHDAVIRFVREVEKFDAIVGVRAHLCTLNEGGDAVCIVCEDAEHMNYWFTFAMTNTSQYILRMFCKTKEIDGLFYFVSERFMCTLDKWEGRMMTDDGDKLHMEFKKILLDIMQGILYFHKELDRDNGEINANNVYIVQGGRAKLGNVLDPSFEKENKIETKFVSDYVSFTILVTDVFERIHGGINLPYELRHFLMQVNGVSIPAHFERLMNHPVFLSPTARCYLRTEAKFDAINRGFIGEVNTGLMNISPRNYHWKSYVRRDEIKGLDSYESCRSNAIGFANISRNACHHVNDPLNLNMTYEELEDELHYVWPEFLCIWFEACIGADVTFNDLWNKNW